MSQFIEYFGNPVANEKQWKTSPISKVAPESPSEHRLTGEVWLLNLDMIESNTGRVIEKVFESDSNLLSVAPFDEGNVLYSKLRPYLNKVVIPEGKGYATTELIPLRPNQEILNNEFLSYLLRSNEFVSYANSISSGTKMPRMPLADLRKFECILPPMDLQQRFVSFAHQADKSEFDGVKSQFIEMFGTIEEPKTEVRKMIDIAVSSGQYGSNTSATDYVAGTPRYIRITDINDDGSLNDDIKSAEIYDEKYRVSINDILFARTGATVGKSYLHEGGNAIYAGYLIKYQMKEDVMRPKFMKAYTHSSTYYDWVSKTQKIGAQPNISAAQYDSMPVIVPSIEEQDAFLAIYNQADKSESELRKSIESIDAVIKSLINS